MLSALRQRTAMIVVTLSLVAAAAPPATAASARLRASFAITSRHVLLVRGTVAPLHVHERVELQMRHGRAWRRVGARAARPRARGRYLLRWRIPGALSAADLRVVVLDAHTGRILARSRRVHLRLRRPSPPSKAPAPPGAEPTAPGGPPPPAGRAATPPSAGGAATYSVPPTTRLYPPAAVAAVEPAPQADEATVTLGAGSEPPVVGGHAALGPAPGLPDGMFASVVSAAPQADGRISMVVRRASVDEVLDDVRLDVDRDVTPIVVDADGNPVASAGAALELHGQGVFSSATATSMFTCESEGIPRSAEDLWSTGLPFPIDLTIEHAHVIDRFDAGSIAPARDPFLLLQLSGQAVASIGFRAKTAFSCQLSDAYRENHRLQFPVGSIGPIPVTIDVEPTLRFEVSAAGQVSLSQRHYFSVTLEKDGFAPLSFHLGHSADPVQLSLDARLEASLFAGGDLSVMFGGGRGSASAEAGVYGAFGPDFTLAASTTDPACLTARAKLEADLGVRLQLLVKRWNLELASLTSPDVDLGGPWCVGSGIDPVNPAIVVSGGQLGTVVSGRSTVAQLAASGGQAPYALHISDASREAGDVPDWVSLDPDGTLTLDPPPHDAGTYDFYVYASDAAGQHSPMARDRVTFRTSPPGPCGGPFGAVDPPAGVAALPGMDAQNATDWSANGAYHLRYRPSTLDDVIVDSCTGAVVSAPVGPGIYARLADDGSAAWASNEGTRHEVHLARADGSPPAVIFSSSEELAFGVAISQDGQHVAFLTSSGSGDRAELHTYDVASGSAATVASWSVHDAVGTLMPVTLNWLDEHGQSAFLTYCSLADESVTTTADICRAFGLHGLWAGEGRIALTSPRSPQLFPVPGDDPSGNPASVFGYSGLAAIAGDGQTLIFQRQTYPLGLDQWIQRPQSDLVEGPLVDGHPCIVPQWTSGDQLPPAAGLSHDGRYLACQTYPGDGTSTLYLLDTQTGIPTMVEENADTVIPLWVADDGSRMIFYDNRGNESWRRPTG